MPHVYSPITELTTHVLQPVTQQLVHKVVDELNLRPLLQNNINIDFGYTAISGTRDQNQNNIVHANRLMCKANVAMLPTGTKWDMLNFNTMNSFGVGNHSVRNEYPIFSDEDGHIALYERNLPCSIVMQFTLSLMDRSVAYEMPSSIFSRYVGSTSHEDLAFSYALPNDILTMLYSMWKYRKSEMPFGVYLRKFSAANISFDVARNNTDVAELIVLKTDLSAISSIDMDEEKPTENKTGQSSNSYDVNFTYTVQFARPEMLFLQYPIVIANQLLPSNMIVIDTNEIPRNLKGPHPVGAFNAPLKELSMVRDSPIQCPYYDDWMVQAGAIARQFSYREFLVNAFLIDEEKGVTTIDLSGDLGDGFQLHPLVKRLLKKQLNETFGLDVIFNITVYSDDAIIEPKTLSLSEDLVLTIPCNDIHKLHHIVISEVTSLEWLNPKWYQDLLDILDTFIRNKESFKLKILTLLAEYIKRGVLTYHKQPDGSWDLEDPNRQILGGQLNDSYWPFRILRADLEAHR